MATMSSVGQLSGRLEEFRLVELLQVMGLGNATGALHLHEMDGRAGLIYFEHGALISCIELDTEALTLGNVLQQLNIATERQLAHAYRLQTHDPLGKRIGERLIDLKILRPEQLEFALRTQTLWTTRELALWQEGVYEFHPNESLPTDGASPRIDPTNAVMEAIRYESEWETLRNFLPQGMRTNLAMSYEPPFNHPFTFSASDWRILSKINRHHTVRRVATTLRMPELELAQMIAPLIEGGLLKPVGASGSYGRRPEEAERLSMEHFDLFTLLISMEQDWIKRKSQADQLVALATFINQTMRTLEDACKANGLSLAPTTLQSLLQREGIRGVEGFTFHVEHNRIQGLDEFAAYCRRALDGRANSITSDTRVFYEQSRETLERALAAAFQAINARIASPLERGQNQEAWEVLFLTFHGQPTGALGV